MLRFACLSCLSLFVTLAVQAEETPPAGPLPGHSMHGEVFDDGPRQRAYLMPGMPKIGFPVTTASEEAARFIEQGVGQLHGFWYFEAERSFRQAAMLDPECAMAYWGMAMANLGNEKRAKGFISEAEKRKEKATERERLYIEALVNYLKEEGKKKERGQALAKAFERILYRFPDDVEAKAFLALQLWKNEGDGVATESYLAYDALLGEVLAAEPMHPAHHFRIHLWDRERPEKAVQSAALCGPSSPGIAHMWHMPGHTYSNLKRYHDAVWQQEASARVDHAYMMRDRVMPDQIHNFAHNNEWCIRNMMHIGRVSDAIALARNMCELPRHSKYNTLTGRGSASLGRERLLGVLAQFELWQAIVDLADTSYLESTTQESEQVRRYKALGTALFRLGRTDEAARIRTHAECNLTSLREQQRSAELAAREQAANEKKEQAEIDKAAENARKAFDGRINDWQSLADQLAGSAAVARGDLAAAHPLLSKANFDRGYAAWIQARSGDHEGAISAAERYVNDHKNEVLPLAWQVEVLYSAQQREKAREAFEKLRELSSAIDLSCERFARLTPIAVDLGLPADWIVARAVPSDLGERPPLDSLGPAAWEPSAAPEFALSTAEGREVSLASYRGRPVVVIFFLGHGCLHCAEQLQKFAPLKERFAAAGFDLLAISSDDSVGLQKSIEAYNAPFPLSLVSDASLDTFKAYRCFDDFEQQPLHGTFVIDAEGRVRWQDIGAEPFMDAQFVLDEGTRLIQLR